MCVSDGTCSVVQIPRGGMNINCNQNILKRSPYLVIEPFLSKTISDIDKLPLTTTDMYVHLAYLLLIRQLLLSLNGFSKFLSIEAVKCPNKNVQGPWSTETDPDHSVYSRVLTANS